MANIIIKGKNSQHKFGKTRSEQEINMRKEWGGTITDEQLDKLKFLEKREKKRTGTDKNFIRANDIDKV
jgi:hypothetical protein